jgi:hypothetical protein
MDSVDYFKNTDPDKLKGFPGLLNPRVLIDILTKSINDFKREMEEMSPEDQIKLNNAIIEVEKILKKSINTTSEEAGKDAGEIAYNTLLASITPVPFVGPSLIILDTILNNSWMLFSFIAETRERINRTILKITKIPGIAIVLRIINTILGAIQKSINDLPPLKEHVLERQAPPITPPTQLAVAPPSPPNPAPLPVGQDLSFQDQSRLAPPRRPARLASPPAAQ